MDNSCRTCKLPVKDPAAINSRCEPGDASRKHSEGAFSGGGIHHLRRPGAKVTERCWSELMISPPERCPVCVKHLPAHNGVPAAIVTKLVMSLVAFASLLNLIPVFHKFRFGTNNNEPEIPALESPPHLRSAESSDNRQ